MSLTEDMAWRYAVKRFAPGERRDAVLAQALEAARLAPTAFGLQPCRILRVEDPALRDRVLAHAYGQDKVAEAGHLLVFARRDPLTEADIAGHVGRLAAARGLDAATADRQRAKLARTVLDRQDPAGLAAWCRAQTYLVLGVFLAACANLRLDACPMEGFDPDAVTATLGLAPMRLRAEALVTVGRRSPEDAEARAAKVRLAPQDFVIDLGRPAAG